MPGFSRIYRLAAKADFQSVFAKPHKITHKFLLTLFRPNQRNHARLGIIISKHHIKRAVDRNSMRRIIRESFRAHHTMLQGLDLVLMVRSHFDPAVDEGKKILRMEVDALWEKVIEKIKRQ